MDEMMAALSRYPNGTYVKIEWTASNLILGGVIDTVYQTDNGLPSVVPDYREYFAAAFRIKDVYMNNSGNAYTPRMVMEVSYLACPSKITLEDETLVWQAQ